MSDVSHDHLAGFCSAPWMEAIAYADGSLKACDRCVVSFGDWQKEGLENVWRGQKLQHFRAAVRDGRFPHEDCASCHNNGSQRTANSSLRSAFFVHQTFVRENVGLTPAVENMEPIFELRQRTEGSDAALSAFFEGLAALERDHGGRGPEFRTAFAKLRVIGETLEDYLAGSLLPRRVATFRQAQLQAKCTARCVMCAGKFTGEIVDGPTMDSEKADGAFAALEDVTDFWCNGAEYLFYKDWKKVALMLAGEGVKMRLSTNGILLTEDTIRFLVDNRLVDQLTLSLDAASRDLLEAIRVNVRYDALMSRLRFLFRYAREKKFDFFFVAGFVMMKRNLHELPAFVRLIRDLAGPEWGPNLTVVCQSLENFSIEEYRKFVYGEHHSLLGQAALEEIFRETLRAQDETGVTVRFYNQTLADFAREGMPFVRFFPKEMDRETFPQALSDPPAHLLSELRGLRLEEGAFSAALLPRWKEQVFSSPVAEAILREFPEIAPVAESKMRARARELFAERT